MSGGPEAPWFGLSIRWLPGGTRRPAALHGETRFRVSRLQRPIWHRISSTGVLSPRFSRVDGFGQNKEITGTTRQLNSCPQKLAIRAKERLGSELRRVLIVDVKLMARARLLKKVVKVLLRSISASILKK